VIETDAVVVQLKVLSVISTVYKLVEAGKPQETSFPVENGVGATGPDQSYA
jgi:hypothetical protein